MLVRRILIFAVLSMGVSAAGEAEKARLMQDTRFVLPSGGYVVMPAGTAADVRGREESRLVLAVGSATATVPAGAAELEPPVGPVARPSVPSPASAPAEAAPDTLERALAVVRDLRRPLSPAQRQQIVRWVWQHEAWAEAAQFIGHALLRDFVSGDVDRPPWGDRLWLARILHWCSRPEKAMALDRLSGVVQRNGVDVSRDELEALLANPDLRAKFASLLGDDANWPRDGAAGARLTADEAAALLASPALAALLGSHGLDTDYWPGALRVLNDLRQHAPEGVARYPALAVALALVHDEAFPLAWPHHQVAADQVPLQWGNWNALFDYFTQKAAAGELAFDPAKLSVDKLKYLVDAPLDVSELQWAAENVTTRPQDFANVFSSIRYSRDRIARREFRWTKAPYRLAAIRQHGGICVDQAYFAWISGKARGIPTLYFEGQGVDGGHAWFGFLRGKDWFMDAGRYDTQQYVAGEARDPQTWEPINDHQIRFISTLASDRTNYQYSRKMLALGSLPLAGWTPSQRRKVAIMALESCPDLPEVWLDVARLLKTAGDLPALATHWRGMAEQFRAHDDLRVLASSELAATETKLGNTHKVERLHEETLRSRADLSAPAAFAFVKARLDAQDYPGALDQFAAALKHFRHPGGNVFYELVRPFVMRLHDAGRPELARQALELARQAFPQAAPLKGSSTDSILSLDFEQLARILDSPPPAAAAR